MSTQSLEDNTAAPQSGLLDSIISQTSLSQEDETYGVVKSGVGALITEMLKSENEAEKVNKSIVDRMISEIDAKISAQMDVILHND
jgi:type VI secretion system protein ImpC